MPERATTSIPGPDLVAHPAVEAWHALQPDGVEPTGIEVLKRQPKSAIYRLHGVGPAGAPVIAKRCWHAAAAIERTLYEDILPQLRISSVRYHGFVEGADGEFSWLFLEDAGEEAYSPVNEEHRALAARWLGRLHTSGEHVAEAARLPDRGPRHYLAHLRSARDTIRGNLGNPALKADDVAVLEAIVSRLDLLEACWSRVEDCCEGAPRTLVHGDFVGKNARVRTGHGAVALLFFDWEKGGWGVPAGDLAQSTASAVEFSANPDIASYWSVVRDHWPRLDRQGLQRLVNCGNTFRCLAAIDWESKNLPNVDWEGHDHPPDWVGPPIQPRMNMRIYDSMLAELIASHR